MGLIRKAANRISPLYKLILTEYAACSHKDQFKLCVKRFHTDQVQSKFLSSFKQVSSSLRNSRVPTYSFLERQCFSNYRAVPCRFPWLKPKGLPQLKEEEKEYEESYSPENLPESKSQDEEAASNLITGIYIGRQLPHDEAERRMKEVPDYRGSSFNAEDLGNDTTKPSAERAQQHEKYAQLWNKMFTDNDVSQADEICDQNVKVHNLLTSSQTTGLKEWKEGLKDIFKDWECKGNEHIVAVTPGNKAFVFWRTSGVYKEDWTSVWGMNILLFNDAGKIDEVASIYQPFPGMREALFK